jgi:hypothetical protein
MACSKGMSVELTSTSALDPGNEMKIFTVVGAIEGNCDIGSVLIANEPTNRMTTDMTIAKTGLCIILLKNIISLFLDEGNYSA